MDDEVPKTFGVTPCEIFVKIEKDEAHEDAGVQFNQKHLNDSIRIQRTKKKKKLATDFKNEKIISLLQQLTTLLGSTDLDKGSQSASNDLLTHLVQPSLLTRKRRRFKSSHLFHPVSSKKMSNITVVIKDPDKHFLASMLPHFKRVPENKKLDLQIEFLNLLKRYR